MSELLPAGWRFTPVEKLKSPEPRSLAAGPFGSSISSKFFVDEGVPVIRGGNLSEGKERFIPGRFVFITSSKAAEFKGAQVKAGDLVFTCWGTLGQVGLIPKSGPFDTYVISNKQLKLRPDRDITSSEFLYYYFSSPTLRKRFNDVAIGSAVPGINLGILRREVVPLPPLPTQRKIAAILTAYDDLIEINKRRIGLLEKMAEELYREWFVRMRFPGHQNTKFAKGVPEGWEMLKIEKAFEFSGGGTPSKSVSSYWNDGTVNWFTPSDITGADGVFLANSEDKCSEEGLARSSAKMFPAYSVMMTSRATIGAIGINTTPACTNQGFITCIPNETYPFPYLYQWLKLAKPYFEQLCGGATFPELTKGTFKKLGILTPSEDVIEKFTELSNPILKSIQSGLEQNSTLNQTRDLLLPRLISGKLSVENLDIQFPPSMRADGVE